MSRTTRKYPIYQYLRHGIIYDDYKDIPEPDNVLLVDEEIKECYYEWEWEWRARYDKNGERMNKLYGYRKRVKVKRTRWVKTGRKIPKRLWLPDNYATIYHYDKKSREGWNGNNRKWLSRGVGKQNKKIRKKIHRAEVRHTIDNWMHGDFECDIPRERTQDRWDWY